MHQELQKLCPKCPTSFSKAGNIIGSNLMVLDDNYSGCGIDICACEKCGTTFQVSYKINEITEFLPFNSLSANK